MDGDFVPIAIYEAKRADVELELRKPGSRSRNERGAPVGQQVQEHLITALVGDGHASNVSLINTMRTSWLTVD